MAAGDSPLDTDIAITTMVTGCMALLANAIGNAWRESEGRALVLAETDPLTGIANRRTFLSRLATIAADPGREFAILMLDLDDFKRLNDERGHIEGDAVLASVAILLTGNLRPGDRVARYGGEEFVVVLPDTGEREATVIAERLRLAIETESPISVSVGCAVRRPMEPPESVLRRADTMLLIAKRTGKNMVRLDSELRETA
jgi:diguanylate cyclase (GGDEF)-like protein